MEKTLTCLLGLCVLCFCAIVLYMIENYKQSRVEKPTVSTLPPPPKPKDGPWFLHVVFLESAKRNDVYVNVDDISALFAKPKTNELYIDIAHNHHEAFKDVERYSFVPASQMGEWLFEEK